MRVFVAYPGEKSVIFEVEECKTCRGEGEVTYASLMTSRDKKLCLSCMGAGNIGVFPDLDKKKEE